MKKILERIFGIALILILGYQQFCYADMMATEPIDLFQPLAFFIGFIVVVVLVITAISYFAFKSTIRKQSVTGNNLNNQEIEEKKDRFQERLYVCGMILAGIYLGYLFLSVHDYRMPFYDDSYRMGVIALEVLFALSIIFRFNKKKKVSNIFCGIIIAIICLIGTYKVISNNYNKQFLEYLQESGRTNTRTSYICIRCT